MTKLSRAARREINRTAWQKAKECVGRIAGESRRERWARRAAVYQQTKAALSTQPTARAA